MEKAEAEALISDCVEFDEGGWDVYTDYDKPTKSGCTLDAFREVYPTASVEDLKRAGRPEIMEVYRTRFLDRLSDVPAFLLPAAFSCAVNAGLRRCHIMIQIAGSRLAYRRIAMDGIVGPRTRKELERLAERHGDAVVITAFLIQWLNHYDSLIARNDKLEAYRRGWGNRVRRHFPLR